MFIEFIQAFALIFIAEMGDKTQILAMAFASKFKIKLVLIGVFIGSLLNHALAVLLGSNLQYILPLDTLSIIAGFSFIMFGLWNLKLDTDEEKNNLNKYGPVVTVALAFFIGELGDKTQLTAIALSADADYPLFILIGTVFGMVFTSMIGIFVGLKLGNRIDEFYIKIGASVIFLGFGLAKLINSLPKEFLSINYIIVFCLTVITIAGLLLYQNLQHRKTKLLTRYQKTAVQLFKYYNTMKKDINDICLGEGQCGLCQGNKCPIGYTKDLLRDAIDREDIKKSYSQIALTDKNFDLDKVRESLYKTLNVLKNEWTNPEYHEVHKIRYNLERILFKKSLDERTFKTYLDILIELDPFFMNLKDDKR